MQTITVGELIEQREVLIERCCDAQIELILLRSIVQDLKDYLNLPKFHQPNRWVNVDDVLHRLEGR